MRVQPALAPANPRWHVQARLGATTVLLWPLLHCFTLTGPWVRPRSLAVTLMHAAQPPGVALLPPRGPRREVSGDVCALGRVLRASQEGLSALSSPAVRPPPRFVYSRPRCGFTLGGKFQAKQVVRRLLGTRDGGLTHAPQRAVCSAPCVA